jgi:hypothetical protein
LEFDPDEVNEGAGKGVSEVGGAEANFGFAGVAGFEDLAEGAIGGKGQDGEVVALAVVNLRELADFDGVMDGSADALGCVGVEDKAHGEFSVFFEGAEELTDVGLFDSEDDLELVAVGHFGEGLSDFKELAFSIGQILGSDDT